MKALKPRRLVLERAQSQQVVDLVLGLLDVAVEHRAVGLDAHAVRDAVDLDPLVGVELAVADHLAHLGMEDLGAAAGQAAETGIAHPAQTSSIESFSRLANQPISMAVKALRWASGKRCFRPRSISRYQSSERSGCRPPTMWNSVTLLPPCSAALA